MTEGQKIRIVFKRLSVQEKETVLHGLLEEFAYHSGLEGLPFLAQRTVPERVQAAYEEGVRHRQAKTHEGRSGG